jgi:type I restriction enzyme S subunit
MSFPRYAKYKDSGVEWLGEVPAHWDVARLKFAAAVQTGVAKGKDNAGKDTINVPYLRVANVQDGYFDLGDVADIEIPLSDLPRYALQAGDVLMNEGGDFDKLGRGHVWDASIRPCIHQNHVFAVRPHGISSAWLSRVTGTAYAQFYFMSRSKQSTNLASISSTNVMELPVVKPPAAEQAVIEAFLDRETAKIDALVAEQEQLITLLKEKRQAVISHAVNKGLDPSVPMKDSGVEWLGEVPAHWGFNRLARLCSQINDINHEMPIGVAEGVPFLSAKDLQDDGTLNFTEDVKQISEEDFLRLSKKILPRRGDIIYSRIGACLGKARTVETDARFLISYSCCVIRLKPDLADLRFMQHLLDGELMLTEARMRTQGIGVPDLGLGEIGRFPIPLPPLHEQVEIANHLDTKLHTFDELSLMAVAAVALLKERRSALISAAVTGQIDVRHLA